MSLQSRKYLYVARKAFAEAATKRAELIGRVVFFAIIMLIFSRLWAVAFEAGGVSEGTPRDLTWYMALTEWVALSVPMVHLDIERDVRTGEVSVQLPRPLSYLGLQLAKGFGTAAAQLAAIGIGGGLLTWLVAGGLPTHPLGLALAAPLVALATGLGVVVLALIGLAAFWLQECGPVYWVWQKLLFILGGLILPLSLYPAWLATAARLTPCAALLNLPASLVLHPGAQAFAVALGAQLFWGAVLVVLTAAVYRRALLAIDVNGG